MKVAEVNKNKEEKHVNGDIKGVSTKHNRRVRLNRKEVLHFHMCGAKSVETDRPALYSHRTSREPDQVACSHPAANNWTVSASRIHTC